MHPSQSCLGFESMIDRYKGSFWVKKGFEEFLLKFRAGIHKPLFAEFHRRHDTQHNDTWHNDIQHNKMRHSAQDTQHNIK